MTRRLLARLGFAATGVLYATIGWAAARVALGGAHDRIGGVGGALRSLLRQPHGRAIVAAVGAGFAGFAIWHALEARRRRRTALARVGHVLGALGYAGLAASAGSLLLRAAPAGGHFDRSLLEWLLAQTWGVRLVQAAGALAIAAGAAQVLEGATGNLRNRFAAAWLPRDVAGLTRGLARFGLAARGVVLIVIGYFQFRVARDLDPREAREIGGALRVLSRSPVGGPLLLGIVAAGLMAYGVYMAVLALAARRI
jgi:hypothetical protein